MTQIKLRRDTAANFTSKNPILGIGEPAYETDTKKLKIGDGTTAYAQLAYFSSGGGSSDITATLPIKIVDGVISLEVDGQTIQIVDGKLHANLDELGNEVNDLSGRVTSAEADILTKQNKLTAGDNITISADNVISATGGSAPTNMVTTDTMQTITGTKIFEGGLTFKGNTNWRGVYNNNSRMTLVDRLDGSASISICNSNSNNAMYGVGGGSSYVTYFQPAYGSTKFLLNNYDDGSSKNGIAPIVEIAGNLQNRVNSTNYQILTQNNVTAGDNITITNTTDGISIAAAGGGGLEVKTASTADFNSSELLETGLYYISAGLNPQNGPSPYSAHAMLVTMKWFSESSNQRIQQTWIGCEDLVANQIYTRYSKGNGVMNSWVRVDSNKIASASALGSIKVGDGLTISSDGTLSPSSKVIQLVESHIDGKSGYRLYSDGYCEQWDDNTGIAVTSITFLKPYKDTNYTVLASSGYPDDLAVYNSFLPHNKTTTGFSINWSGTVRTNMWRAFGYVQI